MSKEKSNIERAVADAAHQPRLAEITLVNLDKAFTYAPWDEDQKGVGAEFVRFLKEAAVVLLERVPRSPLRTRALNMLFDARMLGNAAITHEGVVSE